jgi:subtilisin family serine protease
VSIYSAYPGDQWAWWDGTSFAAPFVSGQAALVLSAGGGDVRTIIRDTAMNIDNQNPSHAGLLGGGRIDCLAAVQ